jgi:carbonic anhydrase
MASSFPKRLLDGYRAFTSQRLPTEQTRYRELSERGQSPAVMVIGCCDSRVSPEVIFDAGPGELFVVRNVANLVPPFETTGRFHGVSAALEFAVLNLRVQHIVVMGHSGCGGVGASLEKAAARQTEAQFIANWMSLLDPGRKRVLAGLKDRPMAEQRAALELEAVKTSLDNLRTFPCVQALEAKGRLSLHGAYFEIAAGSLSALDQATGEFVAI